jgi:hypothetical protein
VSGTGTAWRTVAAEVSGHACGRTAHFPYGLGVAEPAGHRPCPPALAAAVACGNSGSGPVSGRMVAMSAAAAAGATTCLCWWPPGHGQPDTRPRVPTAADTSMATESSLSACAGHLPSGRRSFRKQRTVNPPTAPARYNFLYPSFQGRPCGRPPAAAVLAPAATRRLPASRPRPG